jgi:hypothetical protein
MRYYPPIRQCDALPEPDYSCEIDRVTAPWPTLSIVDTSVVSAR